MGVCIVDLRERAATLTAELRKNGLSNGTALGHRSGLCDSTADMIEALLRELENKNGASAEQDLIDRRELLRQIRLLTNRSSLGESAPATISGLEVCGLVIDAPSVSETQRPRAQWLQDGEFAMCSNCHDLFKEREVTVFNYCPECGAKMTQEDDRGKSP